MQLSLVTKFNQPQSHLISAIFRNAASDLAHEETDLLNQVLAASSATLKNNNHDDDSRIAVANTLRKLKRHSEGIAVLEGGLRPGASAALHHRYVKWLAECNRTAEAIAAADRGAKLFPSDLLFRLKEGLTLPVIYESAEEMDRYRVRYADKLARLSREVRLDSRAERLQAESALAAHTNEALGFQGRNDRELQVMYGEFAHRIMSACYPQWSLPVRPPARPQAEPLRVGYLSARFFDVSATRFFLGWLLGHDPARIQLFCWHVGHRADRVTDEVRKISYRFFHLPDSVEETGKSILACNLHVLVFLDIGLEPRMTQLAALRLAPVQCMAWDQPVTSGLPTIDYAFSSELAEPPDAESHYSEKLLKLPGVGTSYRRPAVPRHLLTRTRADFGLDENAVVYLCCQSVFKFLPDNDQVFVRIAQAVPQARFVFLVHNSLVGCDLLKRLMRAFASAGLDARQHCVLLPEMKHFEYWNLNLIADVFLDTIGWSSAGSIFDALACRLPVVALPGDLMRSRQGLGILTQLGVSETIARDQADYVAIAIRLGRDCDFRREIVERIVEGYPRLYSDSRSVAALEEFFFRIGAG